MEKKYDASNIQVLEGLDAVRKRPGMYIGSTDSTGLHHLIWEILDNSIDEIMNGFGNKIKLTIHKDGSVSVEDNGRGIPVDNHPKFHKPAIEIIFTTLHSGGKFNEDSYKSSGGLHGVGSSVVNALSKRLRAEVSRDGFLYEIEFKNGEISLPLRRVSKTNATGSKIRFWPELEYFTAKNWHYELIKKSLKEKSYLNSKLSITLLNENTGMSETFYSENGLVDMINEIVKGEELAASIISYSKVNHNFVANFALTYLEDEDEEQVMSFANNVKTINGGTHEAGFKSGLSRAILEFIRENNTASKLVVESRDVREGLVGIIDVRVSEQFLQYEGQTKGKLATQEIKTFVENFVYEKMKYFLIENRKEADKILKKIVTTAKIRNEVKKQREVAKLKLKGKKDHSHFLGKLVMCNSRDETLNELFLVEGDSAGGSAKQGRDSKHQAILPLKGKVINSLKTNLVEILKNDEILTITNAIGAGIGEDFDVEKVNYHKVIIMTDADVDGAHIQTLLLTFFFKYMRPLITNGYLFIAKPPLFKVSNKTNQQKTYLHNEEEYQEFCTKHNVNSMQNNIYSIQRYKGLGEMNADQLWETTMDPTTRQLIKVTIEDEVEALQMLNLLMGKHVDEKKEWIQKNIDFSYEDSGFI
ncbi:hypothetical protein ASO20_00325 [Mycoplasma sp. (ex Biomphalaria glabrata)]|uniref:DNA gyrase/topoisomerase IV subunit B n=1 Tax=Mycoplasma sp. (ex Biomphalaria glabrata) TaxID=1749074 RepID=UPI00073AC56F|nr:DNA gyrase subunit B [Mycoplasma sp. (ex Biomphalaria glabrata)]ALV23127.1 hypothetical protein ASO20_00325 [Mycoplasma sp. (ex Biomphalaria glabrata)]